MEEPACAYFMLIDHRANPSDAKRQNPENQYRYGKKRCKAVY